jgi:hypothetical protein
MATTGNKGEWSEIYVLFKLLGDKKVYSGDADLNKIEDLFYPIIKILRQEQEKHFEYSINDEKNVVIVTDDGSELLSMPISNFLDEATYLLKKIKESSSAFSVERSEDFMHKIHCYTLKAKSEDKADIKIVIHDLRTGLCPTLGFSIKSMLGNDSTLLNASKATNFTYRIAGVELSDEQIEKINSISTKSKIQDRIAEIDRLGGKLTFDKIENRIFNNNLLVVDSCLPQLIAELLLKFFSSTLKTIREITEVVGAQNPLDFDLSFHHKYYEVKLKRLLTDVALGMMPTKVWNGVFEANGGYLVVKADGDVLCYHIYDKNVFEDYLYRNTRFETASSTRHEFGKIERSEGGALIFKLNLQIRFLQ